MQTNVNFLFIVLLFAGAPVRGQYSPEAEDFRKYYVGSTFALLGNFTSTNKPEFAQVNFGYRLSGKDVVSLELKTWKYAWPLGIPLGPSFEDAAEEYPGFIREKGFALVYQRFLWRGLYLGVHSMNAWQQFVNEAHVQVDKGFQIFNTYRMGYHVKLFRKRFFIEPSLAVTHRIYHTEMPEDFRVLDDKWSKFFVGEPGLHFGVNF